MQEIINKNSRLQDNTKHICGPLHEKIPSLLDLQIDDEGVPRKLKNY